MIGCAANLALQGGVKSADGEADIVVIAHRPNYN
jgi:hypothetical protein